MFTLNVNKNKFCRFTAIMALKMICIIRCQTDAIRLIWFSSFRALPHVPIVSSEPLQTQLSWFSLVPYLGVHALFFFTLTKNLWWLEFICSWWLSFCRWVTHKTKSVNWIGKFLDQEKSNSLFLPLTVQVYRKTCWCLNTSFQVAKICLQSIKTLQTITWTITFSIVFKKTCW